MNKSIPQTIYLSSQKSQLNGIVGAVREPP